MVAALGWILLWMVAVAALGAAAVLLSVHALRKGTRCREIDALMAAKKGSPRRR